MTYDSREQRGAGIVAVVLIVLIVCTILLTGMNMLAASKIRSARAGWDRTLGSFDEIMARYPATATNPAAHELERIAAELGIDILPRARRERPLIDAGTSRAFHALKKNVWGVYGIDHLERIRREAAGAPPAELRYYVENYADELAAMRHHLITGPTPVWESDLSLLSAAPLPNLLGQLDMTKLLVHAGLERIHAGDRETALEYAEALHRLTLSLRDSPILINQLILIAEVRMLVGFLRQIEDLPEVWVARLNEHDYRRSFVTAMKYEGWVWLTFDERALLKTDRWWQGLAAPVLRPYTKICAADLSAAWRERIANLEQVDAICDYDLASAQADFDIPIPRWNAIGETMIPNLLNALDRLARLEFDIELTQLMVRADAERRAHDGVWPEPTPARYPSRTCPRDGWDYLQDEGTLTIAFSRPIEWPGMMGAILPTRAEMP